jgi:hypothetical protein
MIKEMMNLTQQIAYRHVLGMDSKVVSMEKMANDNKPIDLVREDLELTANDAGFTLDDELVFLDKALKLEITSEAEERHADMIERQSFTNEAKELRRRYRQDPQNFVQSLDRDLDGVTDDDLLRQNFATYQRLISEGQVARPAQSVSFAPQFLPGNDFAEQPVRS